MAYPKVNNLIEAEVSIDGTKLGGDFTIASISIKHEINRIPTAVITIPDGNPAGQTFALSAGSKPKLKPGATVKITFADKNSSFTADLFEGILVKHAVKVRKGISLLVLEAKDKAVKMTIGEQNAYWKEKKDSDIFKALIGNASGTTPDVEDTTYEHKVFFQYNTTDWDFLLMRCQAIGMIVTCKGNKVSVKKPDFSVKKELDLSYGVNVVEVDLEVNGQHQLQAVKASAWDLANLKVLESTKKAPGKTVPDKPGTWTGAALAKDFAPSDIQLLHRGPIEKAELDAWAEARMFESRMARVTGTIKTFGFVVEPGQSIKLKGMGANLNGAIYVTGVRHALSEGVWTTQVQVGLSQKWYRNRPNSDGRGVGYFTGVRGLQPALVTKLEEDPDSQHRIEINLNFWGSSPPCKVWARVAFPNAGKKRGLFWLPTVGDEVLVGFMDGDPSFPVVLGSLYSSKAAPPVTVDSENGEMGIYTSSEMKMVFNDKDVKFSFETPGGHKLTMDDDGEKVEIEDSGGSKVTMDSKGITFKSSKDIVLNASSGGIKLTGGKDGVKVSSSSGDVKIEGLNVKCEAKMAFEGKGKTGAKLESTAIATVKGSLVKIN